MTRTLAVAAIVGLALALTGCSASDSGSGADQQQGEAAQAISDSIMGEQDGATEDVFAMKRAEADCIGQGFVDDIGVEQLQEYGYLTEDLKAKPLTSVTMGTADAEAATSVLFDCADVLGLMEQAISTGQKLDPKTQKCLHDVLTEDKLRSMFTLLFSGKHDQAGQEVIAPMMECAAPQQ